MTSLPSSIITVVIIITVIIKANLYGAYSAPCVFLCTAQALSLAFYPPVSYFGNAPIDYRTEVWNWMLASSPVLPTKASHLYHRSRSKRGPVGLFLLLYTDSFCSKVSHLSSWFLVCTLVSKLRGRLVKLRVAPVLGRQDWAFGAVNRGKFYRLFWEDKLCSKWSLTPQKMVQKHKNLAL